MLVTKKHINCLQQKTSYGKKSPLAANVKKPKESAKQAEPVFKNTFKVNPESSDIQNNTTAGRSSTKTIFKKPKTNAIDINITPKTKSRLQTNSTTSQELMKSQIPETPQVVEESQSPVFPVNQFMSVTQQTTVTSQQLVPFMQPNMPTQQFMPVMQQSMSQQFMPAIQQNNMPSQYFMPVMQHSMPSQECMPVMQQSMPPQQFMPVMQQSMPSQECMPVMQQSMPSQHFMPVMQQSMPQQQFMPAIEQNSVPSQQFMPVMQMQQTMPTQQFMPVNEMQQTMPSHPFMQQNSVPPQQLMSDNKTPVNSNDYSVPFYNQPPTPRVHLDPPTLVTPLKLASTPMTTVKHLPSPKMQKFNSPNTIVKQLTPAKTRKFNNQETTLKQLTPSETSKSSKTILQQRPSMEKQSFKNTETNFKPLKSARTPGVSLNSAKEDISKIRIQNKDGTVQLSDVMSEVLDEELDIIKQMVLKLLPDNKTASPAERVLMDFGIVDGIVNALGLSATQCLLDIHNPLKLQINVNPKTAQNLNAVSEKLRIRNIEKNLNKKGYLGEVYSLKEFHSLLSQQKVKIGETNVQLKADYDFTKVPPQLKTKFTEQSIIKNGNSIQTKEGKTVTTQSLEVEQDLDEKHIEEIKNNVNSPPPSITGKVQNDRNISTSGENVDEDISSDISQAKIDIPSLVPNNSAVSNVQESNINITTSTKTDSDTIIEMSTDCDITENKAKNLIDNKSIANSDETKNNDCLTITPEIHEEEKVKICSAANNDSELDNWNDEKIEDDTNDEAKNHEENITIGGKEIEKSNRIANNDAEVDMSMLISTYDEQKSNEFLMNENENNDIVSISMHGDIYNLQCEKSDSTIEISAKENIENDIDEERISDKKGIEDIESHTSKDDLNVKEEDNADSIAKIDSEMDNRIDEKRKENIDKNGKTVEENEIEKTSSLVNNDTDVNVYMVIDTNDDEEKNKSEVNNTNKSVTNELIIHNEPQKTDTSGKNIDNKLTVGKTDHKTDTTTLDDNETVKKISNCIEISIAACTTKNVDELDERKPTNEEGDQKSDIATDNNDKNLPIHIEELKDSDKISSNDKNITSEKENDKVDKTDKDEVVEKNTIDETEDAINENDSFDINTITNIDFDFIINELSNSSANR